jgi:hypothetical protein
MEQAQEDLVSINRWQVELEGRRSTAFYVIEINGK